MSTAIEELKAKADQETAELPRIYAGVPHLHGIEHGTMVALLNTCTARPHLLDVDYHPSSLLAMGFNQLWCNALNARKYGYFLLLHADISFRTRGFLDVMLRELERNKLDAIHVPQAIKDGRGLTSTGLGNGNDPWARIRRITLTELQELPPTFVLQDAVELLGKTGHVPEPPVFCPNTGCLLVKLGRWSWDFPGFTIQDKLETRVDDRGRCYRHPVTIPEDWNFGFWMQRKGLRVGGCRKVRADHHAKHLSFANDGPGQEARDEGYLLDPARW